MIKSWTDWSDIAQIITKIGGGILFVGASLVSAHAYFQTSAAAEQEHAQIRGEIGQYQQQIYGSLNDSRIDQYVRARKDLEYQLLNPQLSPEQREYLNHQIDAAQIMIDCIRDETC